MIRNRACKGNVKTRMIMFLHFLRSAKIKFRSAAFLKQGSIPTEYLKKRFSQRLKRYFFSRVDSPILKA